MSWRTQRPLRQRDKETRGRGEISPRPPISLSPRPRIREVPASRNASQSPRVSIGQADSSVFSYDFEKHAQFPFLSHCIYLRGY